jgi:hypothetical protein
LTQIALVHGYVKAEYARLGMVAEGPFSEDSSYEPFTKGILAGQ